MPQHIAQASITAQNTFTDPVRMLGPGAWGVKTGTFSATVSLQYRVPGDTTWTDTGDTATAAGLWAILEGADLEFRVGVKTGGFVSGTAQVWIAARGIRA